MAIAPDDKSSLMKGGAAWGAVGISKLVEGAHSIGITTWGEASAAAAFFFSVLLILDFIWRKLFRRWFARKWPRSFPTRRRRDEDFVDTSDHMPLEK